MNKPVQYITFVEDKFSADEIENLGSFLETNGLAGTEMFMNYDCNRSQDLTFPSPSEKAKVVEKYRNRFVKRVHCSYWAYPTSFLNKIHYHEFLDRLGGEDGIRRSYGDLTGDHMFERWLQEYELACELGAQAYVFHVIDYAAIDGAWEFTITREQVLDAMVRMVQEFLLRLQKRGLLSETSPVIELENAGWGLEYGAQRCEDFAEIFRQIYDPFDKVRIGWDLNHLLHAIGKTQDGKGARFMLQPFEITSRMQRLEEEFGSNPKLFAEKWVEMNILDPAVIRKTNCLHLSDCELKTTEYFRNGRLQGEYGNKIDSLQTRDEKEEYGVGIVLDRYDSHVPLGDETGVYTAPALRRWIECLMQENKNFVLLHELKNSSPALATLRQQMDFLWE